MASDDGPRWWDHWERIVPEIAEAVQSRCNSGAWDHHTVKYSISAGIAQVKLDDARTGNALRSETVRALLDICVELHQRPDVKVVVFTASGFYFSTGGAFGGEIDDTPSDTFEAVVAENLRVAYLLYLMSTLPQYKVAAIRGNILGAGISLVAAMDYVVAPESRTELSFKEATRGLGACCSWQATVAKLGAMRLRSLCLLAQDVDAQQAAKLGLVHELVPGATKDALPQADAIALSKAKEVARKSAEERQRLKTTGPWQRQPLPQRTAMALEKRAGPRAPPERLRRDAPPWPSEAVRLEPVGEHMARLTVEGTDGSWLDSLLLALQELHATPPGQIRLVELHASLRGTGAAPSQEVLQLLRQLPQVLLGRPKLRGEGLELLLWMQCDLVLATDQTSFQVLPGLQSVKPPDFPAEQVTKLSATAAHDLGILNCQVCPQQQLPLALRQLCEKLSDCAPNAVAQCKGFIHRIATQVMTPEILRDLALHVARRVEDPEFEDSIRALRDKEHVPIYRRPGHRVVPPLDETGGEEEAEQWQEDGSVVI